MKTPVIPDWQQSIQAATESLNDRATSIKIDQAIQGPPIESVHLASVKPLIENPKLFSHILLGPDAKNTGDEGLDVSTATGYAMQLNNLAATIEQNSELKACFTAMQPHLQQLNEQASAEIPLRQKKNEALLNSQANSIAQAVHRLKDGEYFLMPGGWSGKPGKPGHAIYYCFERTGKSYNIYLFEANQSNVCTQGGSEGPLKNKPHPCKFFANVPSELIFLNESSPAAIYDGLFKKLLQLRTYPIWDPHSSPEYTSDDIDNIFLRFKGYQSPLPNPLLSRFATSQRSGLCATRSLDQLLFFLMVKKLPKNKSEIDYLNAYKRLMFLSKTAALQSAADSFHKTPDKNERLRRGAENLQRACAKLRNRPNPYIPDTELTQAEYLAATVLKDAKIVADQEKIQVSNLQEKGVRLSEHYFNQATNWTEQGNYGTYLPRSIPHFQPLDKTQPLLEQLQETLNRTQNYENAEQIITTVEEFARALPLPNDPVWATLSEDERSDAIDSLFNIDQKYVTAIVNLKSKGERALAVSHLTHMTYLATLWQLAKFNDPQRLLTPFYPKVMKSYSQLLIDDPQFLLDTPEGLKRYNALADYMDSQIGDDQTEIFDFITQCEFTEEKFTEWGDTILYKALIETNPYVEDRLNHEAKYSLGDPETCPLQDRNKPAYLLLLDFTPINEHVGAAAFGYPSISFLKIMSLQSYFLMQNNSSNVDRNGQLRMRVDFKRERATFSFDYSNHLSTYQADREIGKEWVKSLSTVTKGGYNPPVELLNPFLNSQMQRPSSMVSVENHQLSKKEDSVISSYRTIVPTAADLRLFRVFCNPSLQPMALAELMQDHPEYINRDRREAFWRYLYRPYEVKSDNDKTRILPLFQIIEEKQSGYWQMCRAYIAEALDTYYGLQPDKTPKVEDCLFYVRIAQALTHTWTLIHGEAPPTPLIDNEKELLQEWANHPSLKRKEKALVHLHLISYFAQSNHVVADEDYSLIYKSILLVKEEGLLRLSNSEYEDVRHLRLTIDWITRFEAEAAERFNQNPSLAEEVCSSLLKMKKLVPDSEKTHWRAQSPLRFEETTLKDGWVIDLSLPMIANKDGIRLECNNFKPAGDLKRILGDRPINVEKFGNTYWISDSLLGIIKYQEYGYNSNIFRRSANGKWLKYVSLTEAQRILPAKTLVNDFTHWAESAGKLSIDSRKTGKPFAVAERQNHSVVITSTDAERIEPYDYTCTGPISEALKYTKDGKTYVTFPRYLTADKQTLRFDEVNNHSVYQPHPQYFLSNPPDQSPLGRFNDGLWLKHKDSAGRYKLLVPKLPIESKTLRSFDTKASLERPEDNYDDDCHQTLGYHEYDLIDGVLHSDTVEGNLQLAWIFLAQNNYLTALKYLKEVSASDTLEIESETLLNHILANLERDASPNTTAVTLYAFYLYRRHLPFNELNFSSLEAYQSYLAALNNVHVQLQLSEDHEMRIQLLCGYSGERAEMLKKRAVASTNYAIVPANVSPVSYREQLQSQALQVLKSNYSWTRFPYWHNHSLLFKTTDSSKLPNLVPGRVYPNERFANDYLMLKSARISQGEKDDFIFQLLLTSRQFDNEEYEFKPILLALYLNSAAFPEDILNPPIVTKPYYIDRDWTYEEYRNAGFEKLLGDIREKMENVKNSTPSIPLKQIAATTSTQKIAVSATSPQISPFYRPSSSVPPLNGIKFDGHDPDDAIGTIVNAHLIEQPKLKNPQQSVSFAITSDQLTEEELPYEEPIRAECQKYDEELDIGRKQNEALKTYEVPDHQGLKKLLTDVDNAKEKSCKAMEDLEKCLLLKAAERPLDRQAAHKEELLELGTVTEKPSLRNILRAANSKSPKESLKKLNPHLTEQDTQAICDLTRHYLMEATVFHQMEKVCKSLTKMDNLYQSGKDSTDAAVSSYWSKACIDLTDRRTYNPKENMNALLFEYLSGMRVKAKQAYLIDEVMKALFNKQKPKPGIVFQLIMGGGKTSVILSTLLELTADNEKVPFFLTHHSQYTSARGNLKAFQKDRFEKDVVTIDYTRLQMADIRVLNKIMEDLEEAKKQKSPIIMNTPMLQAIGLELYATAMNIAENDDAVQSQRAIVLGKILSFVKTDGLGVFDEIDINLIILLGVHFPRGEKKYLQPERIQLVRKIYEILATDPTLKPIVRLDKNEQAQMSPTDYQKKVKPLVAKLLADQYQQDLALSDEHKPAFVRYITGQISKEMERVAIDGKQIPLNDTEASDVAFLQYLHNQLAVSPTPRLKRAAGLIALSKQVIREILPLTLSRSFNRSYGRAPTDNHPEEAGKICPYLGVGKPATTDFANMDEALCYYFQTTAYPEAGVSPEQILYLARAMMTAANNFSQINREPFDETAEAQIFKQMTGVSLEKIEDPAVLQAAVANVNKDIHRRLDIEAETAGRVATFNAEILSSSPITAVDMLSQSVGCSGTPWNETTYNDSMREFIPDKGTEGKIIDKILANEKIGAAKIYSSKTDDVKELLTNILKQHPKADDIRGLTDTGGWFKRYTTLKVAQEILAVYENNPNVEAVLFHWTNPVTQKEEFALLKKGDLHPRPLLNTQLSEILKYGVPLEKIFVYHDELRTTGTDIPENPRAINLVTIDPLNVSIRSFLQSILRLREYFFGQNVDFVYPEHLSHLLLDNGNSVKGLIQTFIKNQAIQKAKQTEKAYMQKIHDAFRSYVYLQLVELAKTGQPIGPFANQYRPFICNVMSDNLFEMYAYLDEEGNTLDNLKDIAAREMKRFIACKATPKDIEEVQKMIDSILAFAVDDKALPKKMMIPTAPISMESQIEISRERELEVKREKEVQEDKELLRELEAYNHFDRGQVLKETPWGNFEATTLSELTGPPILTLAEGFKETFDKHQQLDKRLHVPDYSPLFPKNLEMSANFHRCLEGAPIGFSYAQKPGDQILVYKDDKGELRFRLLSLIDTEFFRNWIADKKPENVWLMNPKGQLLESRGKPLPSKKDTPDFYEELKTGLWHIHFFNGNTLFLSKKKNMTETNLDGGGNTSLKLRYLKTRTFKEPIYKSMYENDALYHPDDLRMQIAVSGFVCGKRLKQEEEKRNKIANYSDDEIRKIRSKDAPFVPNEKIHLLQTIQQVRKLPPQKVKYVSVIQVSMLTLRQIKFLDKAEQIHALGTDQPKIQALLEPQIALINEEQVACISDEQISFVKGNLINKIDKSRWNFLDPKQIPEIEEVESLDDRFLINVVKKQVPRLTDRQVKKLSKPDQIAAIKIEQASIISLPQWTILAAAQDKIDAHATLLIQTIPTKTPNAEGVSITTVNEGLIKYFSDLQKTEYAKTLKGDKLKYLKETSVIPFLTKSQLLELYGEAMVPYFSPSQVEAFSINEPIDVKRVPFLTQEQLIHLNGPLFAHVSEWQEEKMEEAKLLEKYATFIPNDRLPKVKAKNVIQALPIDKLRRVSDTTAAHFTDAQIASFTKAEKTDVRRVPLLSQAQLEHLPDPLFAHLSDSQVSQITKQTLVVRVTSDKVNKVSNEMLKFIPKDPRKLKRIQSHRLHHLSKEQLKMRIAGRSNRLKYVIEGLFGTLMAPFKILAELIYNLVIAVFKTIAYIIKRTPQSKMRMVRQIKKIAADPACSAMAPVQVLAPTVYMQRTSRVRAWAIAAA